MSFTEQKNTLLQQVIQAWTRLQEQQPLVQCITNSVATNYAANILLAAGASPAMIDNPFEAESFANVTSALSINLGTPTTEQMQAMLISAQTVDHKNTPWVLDPVGYGPVLKWRSSMVDQLLAFKPSVIRGNASEISALAGKQVQAKGVDSTISSHTVYRQHNVCLCIVSVLPFLVKQILFCHASLDWSYRSMVVAIYNLRLQPQVVRWAH